MSPTTMQSPLRPQLPARLLLSNGPRILDILIDSGADAFITDEGLVQQLGLERVPLSAPVSARALDGHVLGTVTHKTGQVPMLLSENHHELAKFHILNSPNQPLILGFPWLC